MRKIVNKDFGIDLVFHVEGRDNEYKATINETRSNGKHSKKEDSFNAEEFVYLNLNRKRTITTSTEKNNSNNEAIKLCSKSKDVKELGSKLGLYVTDSLKLPGLLKLNTDLRFCLSKLEMLNGAEVKDNDLIKQFNDKVDEINKLKRFYKCPSNESEVIEYFDAYLKIKLSLDMKSLLQVKKIHDKNIFIDKEMLKEGSACFVKAKSWLKEHDNEKFVNCFPGEVKVVKEEVKKEEKSPKTSKEEVKVKESN